MINILRITLILVVLLFYQTLVFGQFSKGALESQIDRIIRQFVEEEDFQGAVLVGHQGDILYQDAFGLANREWNVENTVDTKFNLASISKQFTAALILQLAEEGKIDLKKTIADYYSEYRQDIGQQVTLHQLLTHQSGIPNYTSLPFVWSDSLYRKYSKEELIAKFASGNLEFEPGSRYQYNNSGYLILSYIIEKVTGQSFSQVFKERIVQPLGLKNTGVDDRRQIISQRADGYNKTSEGYENVYSMYMQNLQGAGNLYGTIGDLYRWDQALYQTQLLSKKSLNQMTRPYTDVNQQWISPYENRYGYGVGIAKIPFSPDKTATMIFHSGHIRGFSGFYARFPEEEFAVIILSNTGEVSTARLNLISLEVAQMLDQQLSPVAKAPKKRKKAKEIAVNNLAAERDLSKAMYAAWARGGADAAVDQYYQLTESFPYDYPDTRQDLIGLSQQLNREGNTESALTIAELNSRVNPHWKTFFELATIHQQLGQKEEAARHFQKALSVNPNRTEEEQAAYQNAQKALKILL